jgi:ribonuclease D
MPATAAEFRLITDNETLDRLIGSLDGTDLIAIDTEFVREKTYFPELCVVQIASAGVVAAVDCLADIDLDRLGAALLSADRSWVLHSARQDLEVLFNRFGGLPARLIDTQIAAALLGFPLQIGLKGLLSDLLGVTLGKEHTRADWSRRPLAEEILEYALDDVRHLLPGWEVLRTRLAARSTRGAGGLRGRQRAAAMALVGWREQRAIDRNRPRRWILTDEQLVAIAAALPGDAHELGRVPELPPRLVERSAQALLAALRDAPPVPDPPDSRTTDKAAVRALKAEVSAVAEALGIQPELLATRKEIAQAAGGEAPESFTAGWRGLQLAPIANRLRPVPES